MSRFFEGAARWVMKATIAFCWLVMISCEPEVVVLDQLDAGSAPDAGHTADAGGGRDAASEDAGPDPDTGSLPDAGPRPPGCEDYARAGCQRNDVCYPLLGHYLYPFGIEECISRRTAQCEREWLADDAIGPDFEACIAVYDVCDATTNDFRACEPLPGGRGEGEACRFHSQCGLGAGGVRLRCAGTSWRDCDVGTCQPALAEHSPCTLLAAPGGRVFDQSPCDAAAGFACVRAYDEALPGRTAAETTCERWIDGGLDDVCAPNSSRNCAPGLRCDAALFRCVPESEEGEPCDGRAGVSCRALERTISCDSGSMTCVDIGPHLRRTGEACSPDDYCPFRFNCPAEGFCPSTSEPNVACSGDGECPEYQSCIEGTCATALAFPCD
jgi:hypothetical protein